jgi:hypothetical protein
VRSDMRARESVQHAATYVPERLWVQIANFDTNAWGGGPGRRSLKQANRSFSGRPRFSAFQGTVVYPEAGDVNWVADGWLW